MQTEQSASEAKMITIKLPRFQLPSLQAGILILLIIVGVLQTVQLYGLNLRIASGQTKAASPSAAAASDSSGSATSSLPNMVGGC